MDQHGLSVALDLLTLFWPRWRRALPLRRLLLSFRIVAINPIFVTSDNLWKKFRSSWSCCCSLQISMRTLSQSSCWVPLTKFIDIYRIIVPRSCRGLGWSVYNFCRIGCLTFATFPGVMPFDGCPERSVSVWPFLKIPVVRLFLT
jgi:hypothetical protein